MFLDFIEDEGFAFEVVYNNETNKVEIYIVYWYNDKKKRWKTKLIFQVLHAIKSVVRNLTEAIPYFLTIVWK